MTICYQLRVLVLPLSWRSVRTREYESLASLRLCSSCCLSRKKRSVLFLVVFVRPRSRPSWTEQTRTVSSANVYCIVSQRVGTSTCVQNYIKKIGFDGRHTFTSFGRVTTQTNQKRYVHETDDLRKCRVAMDCTFRQQAICLCMKHFSAQTAVFVSIVELCLGKAI